MDNSISSWYFVELCIKKMHPPINNDNSGSSEMCKQILKESNNSSSIF